MQFKAVNILSLVCPGLNEPIKVQDNRIRLLIESRWFSLKNSLSRVLLIHHWKGLVSSLGKQNKTKHGGGREKKTITQ